ncbi:DUF6691 family protein [Halomonas sp. Mc5H-6]|uniref:DUF6691 family protein n=1 Tax=Halomonas sp. Mc5H-6 TaxID=2954500 RepID=UPI0020973CDB|nr:DUF6691 family protein [Halomonas sp. Mc5H-6]MCO7246651.1 YeeE/YedE family protein [Halomonas sp. Mc5H-6]
MNKQHLTMAASYVAGLLFSLGLTVSGMTDPARVVGFLDVAGKWDPTLMFVLGGAVITTFVGYRFVLKQPTPLLAKRFQLPGKQGLDARLLTGAALFGVGWGLSGYCPGPAIASLGGASVPLVAMLATMVLGWVIARRIA